METRASAPSTRKRFALTGRSRAFDRRIDAARGDLADVRLADRLFAPHYVAAAARGAMRATMVLDEQGAPVSELLQGENFEVLELAGGRAWGRCSIDGSVGFVDAGGLGPMIEPTHIVSAPSIVSERGARLPMGARLAGVERDDVLVTESDRIPIGGVRPIGEPVADTVALAEALVGTSHRTGGRSGGGVDCSGLVFLTLCLGGIPAPRFRDLQATSIGRPVSDGAPILRGDLLYFDDHVAIAASEKTVVHASAETREVVQQPLDALLDGNIYGPLNVRRRMP